MPNRTNSSFVKLPSENVFKELLKRKFRLGQLRRVGKGGKGNAMERCQHIHLTVTTMTSTATTSFPFPFSVRFFFFQFSPLFSRIYVLCAFKFSGTLIKVNGLWLADWHSGHGQRLSVCHMPHATCAGHYLRFLFMVQRADLPQAQCSSSTWDPHSWDCRSSRRQNIWWPRLWGMQHNSHFTYMLFLFQALFSAHS